MPIPVEDILDYRVTTYSLERCLKTVCDWLFALEGCRIFVCANPHSLVLARHDPLFQQAIHGADLVTPDGAGIVLASKILGGSIRERITGSDIFWGLSEEMNRIGGKSYFFLGSTDETLAAIKRKMAIEYPDIRFAGSYSPPYKAEFSEEDSRKMVDAVNSSQADVLWVGMTAPKQEKWIHQYRDRLDVRFIGAIGAVFDFYVGNVKRSRPVFQKLGLEWLPRLLQEPRRLFRRNFVSSPLFLWFVFRQKIRQQTKRAV
ncbi:MAG: WecB/TagA/CpsF family glycosyltransferase [Candidatus Scalindua sp.]